MFLENQNYLVIGLIMVTYSENLERIKAWSFEFVINWSFEDAGFFFPFIIIELGLVQGWGQILKKKQQLVRWHGRFHSTSTLLSSRFHAISCNWYVHIQSPALAAKNSASNSHSWKPRIFLRSTGIHALDAGLKRFFFKLLHRTNFQPLREHIS